jgi:uncharacterized protein (AIM24 family)
MTIRTDNSNDNNKYTPSNNFLIDLSVSAKIEGQESQIVTVQLQPGQGLRAESASMLYMTEGVEMDTTLGGENGGAAVSGALKRMLTGQNVFLTDFTYQGKESGTVALGTDFPSKIVRINLDDMQDNTLICQRGYVSACLCVCLLVCLLVCVCVCAR